VARISQQFGVIIRKARLAHLGLDLDTVLERVGADVAFDEDEQLLSLGPHFDDAAATALAATLTGLGLAETDDFFVFRADVPDWCELVGVARAGEDTQQ
jgi:hypothetical protein